MKKKLLSILLICLVLTASIVPAFAYGVAGYSSAYTVTNPTYGFDGNFSTYADLSPSPNGALQYGTGGSFYLLTVRVYVDAASPQPHFHILWQDTSGGMNSVSDPSFTVKTDSNNRTYYEYVTGNSNQVNLYSVSGGDLYVDEFQVSTSLPSPTGLTAARSGNSVNLSWNSVTSAASYNIYRNGSLLKNVTTTSYSDNTIALGNSYSYSVAAVDSAGNSSATSTPATVSLVAPAAPTVTATAGNNQVNLSWAAVDGATSYNITTVSGSTITGITGTTYNVTGLKNGQPYSFYMNAVNANGTSANSNTVTATPAAPVPAAPSGLTGSAGNGQVSLSWSATTNAEYGYNIYQDGTKINTSYVTATSYNISGLSNGTSHTYTVTAVSSGGESPQSSSVSLTPTVAIPAAPTQLAATASNATVLLSWQTVSNADSYNIYKDGQKINSSPVTSNSFKVSNLQNGKAFSFQITAVNAGGESPKSNPVSATPFVPSPSVNGSSDNATVTLSWSAIPGVDSYNVYQDGVKITTTTATTYTITGLQNDKTYSFSVTSNSGGVESSPSAPVALTPTAVMPVPAQNISSTGTSGGSGTLTWTVSNPPGQQNYSIYQDNKLLGTTTDTTFALTNYNPNSPFKIVAQYGDKTVSSTGGGGVIQSSPNKWGFLAGDIFSNSVNLVMSVAGFILLFLIFLFAPRLFEIVKKAMLKGNYRQYKSGVKKSYRYDGERWNYQYTDDLGRDWYKTGSGSWDKGSFLDRASKDIKTDWIDKT